MRIPRYYAILAPLAATLLAVPALAGQEWRYALDSAASDVSARVGLMGLSNKTARFTAITGTARLDPRRLETIELDVYLDARALRAGDRVTLDRLKGPQFFDVANHPTVRFSGRSMRLTGPRTAAVSGQLTTRGITRPEVLSVTFDRDPAAAASPMGLTGTMRIDRRHYGMTAWNGIVANKVDITIRTRMVPN